MGWYLLKFAGAWVGVSLTLAFVMNRIFRWLDRK